MTLTISLKEKCHEISLQGIKENANKNTNDVMNGIFIELMKEKSIEVHFIWIQWIGKPKEGKQALPTVITSAKYSIWKRVLKNSKKLKKTGVGMTQSVNHKNNSNASHREKRKICSKEIENRMVKLFSNTIEAYFDWSFCSVFSITLYGEEFCFRE